MLEAKGFWNDYWGKTLEPKYTSPPRVQGRQRRRADQDTQSPRLPIRVQEVDVLPEAPSLVGLLDGFPFLVRAEYIRMYEYVEDCFLNAKREFMKPPAVIITGQPGIGRSILMICYLCVIQMLPIGKTIWMNYALRRCLGEKRPVMYGKGNKYLAFWDSGVTVEDAKSPIFGTRKPKEQTPWCLIDSTFSKDGIPVEMASAFMAGANPIYLTSPDNSRWRKLDQSRSAYSVLMNPWTLQEMLHA